MMENQGQEFKAGTQRRELEQRLWGNTSYLPAPMVLSGCFFIYQGPFVWGWNCPQQARSSHQSLIKRLSYRLAYRSLAEECSQVRFPLLRWLYFASGWQKLSSIASHVKVKYLVFPLKWQTGTQRFHPRASLGVSLGSLFFYSLSIFWVLICTYNSLRGTVTLL